jgi:hypothetical protein
MRTVVIESPYAGDVTRNLRYLRAALRDCLRRGEAPFASHALYPTVLDDFVEEERKLGIEAGFAVGAHLDAVVFYTDLGWSNGMRAAALYWRAEGREIEERSIPEWEKR